ncbi:glyoxalase superfamily protein [Sphingomonas sp.]|uniref:glyoxalase superfamily protein n=1 Tax=Sphingomonas sp. TaxID=28214 RepID=UPI003CC58EBC
MTDPPLLHFQPAVPILFVRDVATAARHYRDQLGFAIDFLHGEPPFYGAVARGAACLHLRHVGKPNFGDLAAREPSLILATIAVDDVDVLATELAGRGATIIQPLADQPWGGRDIQVEDPDGNRLSFVTYRAAR